MHVTPFGRLAVEIEDLPTGVPLGSEPSFAPVLERRVAPPPRVPEGPRDAPAAASEWAPMDRPEAREPPPPEPEAAPEAAVPADSAPGAGPARLPELEPPTGTPRRSTKTAPPDPSANPSGRLASLSTRTASAPVQMPPVPTESPSGPTAAPLAARPAVGKPASALAATNRSPRSQAATPKSRAPGYASASPQLLELAREQRDLMFRRIGLALSQGGGSMHVWLEPRELGSLTIQLELKGTDLHVHLSAERSEVANALLEDKAGLERVLAAQGLDVRDLEVRTGSREHHERDAASWAREKRESASEGATDGTADAEQRPGLLGPRLVRFGSSVIDFIA